MKLRLERSSRDAIGGRLRELRRFNQLEQTVLAEMAGLSQAIISQYEKGLTEVSLSFINFLVEKFEISADWLLFGDGNLAPELPKLQGPPAPAQGGGKKPAAKLTEFYTVPVVDPREAARPGTVNPKQVLDWQLVSKKDFRGRKNLLALDARAPWVEGLFPPFRPGSRVIIDRGVKNINPGSYYALDSDTKAKSPRTACVNAICRLNLSGSNLWLIKDNPTKTFECIPLRSRNDHLQIIVGKVVWISQKLP